MIESAGHFGKVKEVQIFNTILETVDARTIIIPNSEAIGSSIINLSMVSKKRVDIDVGISYSDSIDRAREVMTQVAHANSMVLKDEPIII
jgi:small conductance mechanosensitive channel